ncbi:MAG: carph-isopro domain-containing protein [Candidatus Binataceae bacterium]
MCKFVYMNSTDPLARKLDHSWIIARFGGVRPLAEALGHAHPTTVQAWKRRKVIPVRQIPAVIAAAAARGLALTPEDFFVAESER